MKTTYKKQHTNPKAANAHIAAVKKRGGKVEKKVSKGIITVISTYGSAQKNLKF